MRNPHLHELRNRLLAVAGVALVAAGGLWWFKEPVLHLVLRPVDRLELLATGVGELFFVYLKMAIWGGMLAAVPVLFYNLWRFMLPGLRASEKRWLALVLLGSPTLLACGALFAHVVLMPLMVQFFIGYQQPGVLVQPQVSGYVGLWLATVFTFGLAFNFPIVLLLLLQTGLIRLESLMRNRRFAIVLIFIIAAIATPPDPVSQTLLAIPLLVLYEGTILLAKMLGIRAK